MRCLLFGSLPSISMWQCENEFAKRVNEKADPGVNLFGTCICSGLGHNPWDWLSDSLTAALSCYNKYCSALHGFALFYWKKARPSLKKKTSKPILTTITYTFNCKLHEMCIHSLPYHHRSWLLNCVHIQSWMVLYSSSTFWYTVEFIPKHFHLVWGSFPEMLYLVYAKDIFWFYINRPKEYYSKSWCSLWSALAWPSCFSLREKVSLCSLWL